MHGLARPLSKHLFRIRLQPFVGANLKGARAVEALNALGVATPDAMLV